MVKKLDDIYVCFENNGKFFRNYNLAYYNSKHSTCKRVNYVFTPTMQICKNVGELERVSRLYFSNFDCDYIDLVNKQYIKQTSLLN